MRKKVIFHVALGDTLGPNNVTFAKKEWQSVYFLLRKLLMKNLKLLVLPAGYGNVWRTGRCNKSFETEGNEPTHLCPIPFIGLMILVCKIFLSLYAHLTLVFSMFMKYMGHSDFFIWFTMTVLEIVACNIFLQLQRPKATCTPRLILQVVYAYTRRFENVSQMLAQMLCLKLSGVI